MQPSTRRRCRSSAPRACTSTPKTAAASSTRFLLVGQSSWARQSAHRRSHRATGPHDGARALGRFHARCRGRTGRAPAQTVARGNDQLFFSDDGSTAVEVALKMAVQHFSNSGREKSRESWRWSTAITAIPRAPCPSATIRRSPNRSESMRYPVHRVHSAYCYRCPVGLTRATCHIECVQQLEGLLEENTSGSPR